MTRERRLSKGGCLAERPRSDARPARVALNPGKPECGPGQADRKSTRLNSSHLGISYAVFCLIKKNDGERIWHALGRVDQAQSDGRVLGIELVVAIGTEADARLAGVRTAEDFDPLIIFDGL